MKYCRYCGKEIDDDSTFCTHCGKSQYSDKRNDIFSWGENVKQKMSSLLLCVFVKPLRILANYKRPIFKWTKRILVCICGLVILYLLISIGSWGYYTYQESKWNSYDQQRIHNSEGNKILTDTIAIQFINEGEDLHYKLDLLGLLHTCDFDHKTIGLSLLQKNAEKGDATAQLLLGRYYKYGSTGSFAENHYEHISRLVVDYDKSSYWFLQAAKQGNAEAQGELGHSYKYGNGVKQNFSKAFYWLKMGADNGDAVAQWRLGNVYSNGLAYYRFFADYQYWWYDGWSFKAKDNPKSSLKDEYVQALLDKDPEEVFVDKNIKLAKHYWVLAAKQGLEEAKEALQKIYE